MRTRESGCFHHTQRVHHWSGSLEDFVKPFSILPANVSIKSYRTRVRRDCWHPMTFWLSCPHASSSRGRQLAFCKRVRKGLRRLALSKMSAKDPRRAASSDWMGSAPQVKGGDTCQHTGSPLSVQPPRDKLITRWYFDSFLALADYHSTIFR